MRRLIWLIALFMIPSLAMASGDKLINKSDNVNEVNVATGTGDSTAFGFGHAMGDVDIAQCLGSTQWDTILGGKQKLVLNNVCMAEFYLNNGKWALAAMALCNQKEILHEFASEAECERAHDFAPPPPPPAVVVPTPGPQIDCCVEEDIHYQQQEQVSIVQDDLETIEMRLARIERGEQNRRNYAQMTIERLENDPEK